MSVILLNELTNLFSTERTSNNTDIETHERSVRGNKTDNILTNIITNTRTEYANEFIAENNKIHVTRYFDELCGDLIANIASYLCLHDHINFSQSEKAIYICLRTNPLSIAKLSLNSHQIKKYCSYIKNKPNILKSRFKMIKQIGLDLDDITEFDASLFPKLEVLTLCSTEHLTDKNRKLLTEMNCSSVKKFTLLYQGNRLENDLQSLFTLTKMDNIEYFWLQSECFFATDNALCNINLLKNVKHLILIDDMQEFVDKYKHQLQSLHMTAGTYFYAYPKETIFNNLQELCLLYVPNRNQCDKYKTFTQCPMLERVHFGIDIGCLTRDDYTFFDEMWSANGINFISIYKATNRANFPVELIDTLTMSLSKYQKDRIKVRLGMNVIEFTSTDKILALINSMEKYSTNFMFIFQFNSNLIGQLKSLLNSSLSGKYMVAWLHDLTYSNVGSLVVSNINCNICGYKERWNYDSGCDFCTECIV